MPRAPGHRCKTDQERKDRRRIAQKKWQAKNRDKVRAAQKRSYEKHKEKRRAAALESYYKNHEFNKMKNRKYGFGVRGLVGKEPQTLQEQKKALNFDKFATYGRGTETIQNDQAVQAYEDWFEQLDLEMYLQRLAVTSVA